MAKVLIKYSITKSGFFGPSQYESSEIVEFDPEKTKLEDVIENDLKKWRNMNHEFSISVTDFKLLEYPLFSRNKP